MDWNEDLQQRFDELRHRELAGPLSEAEQHELAELFAALEQDEARYLAPLIEGMAREADSSETALVAQQYRNEELATLVQQHGQLVVEARDWLDQFDRRRELLKARYADLTRGSMPGRLR